MHTETHQDKSYGLLLLLNYTEKSDTVTEKFRVKVRYWFMCHSLSRVNTLMQDKRQSPIM